MKSTLLMGLLGLTALFSSCAVYTDPKTGQTINTHGSYFSAGYYDWAPGGYWGGGYYHGRAGYRQVGYARGYGNNHDPGGNNAKTEGDQRADGRGGSFHAAIYRSGSARGAGSGDERSTGSPKKGNEPRNSGGSDQTTIGETNHDPGENNAKTEADQRADGRGRSFHAAIDLSGSASP